ncbi:AI-2E family transporter [Dokdonia sp. Hel_I_53]|uniref:AI-2E family transporter n=1 Tax=Dokdonia sp. Hel_I_53 TaxID=1566287 RepID=UPI00119B676E|nr:AI-2E family transporter [Dokdonia sp. Hel_I_53]TVZ51313.1 putative PurR-regulated permease PerM [Dokdonia sp. Hel_I_53]
MKSKAITTGILRAIGVIVGILVILWLLYMIQSVIVYLAVAAVLSLVGRPLVKFLRYSLKLTSTWAAIVTIILQLLVIVGILALFIPVIIDQSQHLSRINFDEVKINVNRLFEEVALYFGIDKTTIIQGVQEADFVKNFDFGVIPSFLNGIIGNMGAALVGLFAVIFITFFFLKDSRLLVHSILAFAPSGNEGKFLRAFEKIKYLLSRYFIGLLIQVFVMFILYAIILVAFGINNALPIALFCAVLNLVPYLGPLVGAGVMLLLATSTYIEMDFRLVILPKLIYIFICYGAAQMVDNFIIQPFVFGGSVKSHPLEIFLAIIISGLLFGVVGMILAIPVYTALKVISGEFLSEYKIVQKLTRGL